MKLTKLLGIASLLTTAIAANSSSYATFVHPSAYKNDFIWSINAVQSTGDVFFHLQSPYTGSWVAVGFGNQMANSLMVVAYPSSNLSSVTVSPRIAPGHVEPSYTAERTIELIMDKSLRTPNQIVNGVMYVDGVCRKCATWTGGSLDLKAKDARFILAVGAGYIYDDSQEAPLKRHDKYGAFTMDMTAATSPSDGSVPNPDNGTYTAVHATSATSVNNDYHYRGSAHAGLMILSWIVLFPLGSLLLRGFNKVKLHAVVQCVGMLLILVSFGLGIYVSQLYNRSNSFKSAHQIIGIVLTIGLFAQLGLGIVGHRIFKRTNQPSKLAKIHVILGTILIAVAIINGALGLRLAQDGQYWLRYILFVLAVFIIFTVIRILARRCTRRRQKPGNHPPPHPSFPEQGSATHNFTSQGSGPQDYGQQGSTSHGIGPDAYQLPSYSAATAKQPHVQSVPLTTYNHNNEHESNFAGPAQQPRQMV